jgi:hypothetical protein
MLTNGNASASQGAQSRPSFLITIDTEGDGIWDRPRAVETRNAGFLPRFQALCERYGLKPTYLTNYEMAISPAFRDLGRDALKRDAAEIGMHLHAWYSPPDFGLTENDHAHHPYLIEYPREVMRAKIAFMTDLLEDTFDVKMLSHRAGRWSFDSTYARLLVERGYRVDCSVTPYVSWRGKLGDPRRVGGTDYSGFPDFAYFVDLDDIGRAGISPLLEVPMTILAARPAVSRLVPRMFPTARWTARVAGRLFPVRWLRPDGKNLRSMLAIVERAAAEKRRHVEFMLHSSEFMPGGSPTFRTAEAIEVLYDHLEQLFERVAQLCQGTTLSEFYHLFQEGQISARAPETA